MASGIGGGAVNEFRAKMRLPDAASDEPIAVLGYAYALERMALFSTEESVAAIERLIPARHQSHPLPARAQRDRQRCRARGRVR